MWCEGGVFESVMPSDEALNFKCKIWIVLSSFASWNVFVFVVEYGVEIV